MQMPDWLLFGVAAGFWLGLIWIRPRHIFALTATLLYLPLQVACDLKYGYYTRKLRSLDRKIALYDKRLAELNKESGE